MSSTYGENIRVSIFGQSHSAGIGVNIEGLPAGERIDMERLQTFLDRRAPGKSELSTARSEADVPEFLSGLVGDVTCGAPLCAIIRNGDTRSKDYSGLGVTPRPGHADYTAAVKYGGNQDVAGGGHFSGRLTAPLCIAGGICLQLLEREGIAVTARIHSVGGVSGEEKMREAILAAKAKGDSVGGVIECCITGAPVGLGDPMFGGMENRIAQIVFGIPAIRGLEFGTGFEAASLRGSVHNDPYYTHVTGEVRTKTNHHGGILGGITSGMPLIFRAAVKPTPSIALEQSSVSLSAGEDKKLVIHGRHDPCIVPRAVPVMEAAAAAAIYDAYLCSK